ncbi:MAG: DUF2062 domain-containing protein, partial [Gammaproteobacteria bacterium]|nr:DUF2062 domain-containing protein [Gammaproteobacteria bacterium]
PASRRAAADNGRPMIRRLLRALAQRAHTLRDRRYARAFGRRCLDPALCAPQRRPVARGFGIGLAICFVPVPVHIPLAMAIGVRARMNLPAVLLGVMAVNPLTVVPTYDLA